MEERIYKVQGHADEFEVLEFIMGYMNCMKELGTSRRITIYYDGDGSAELTFLKENDQEITIEWDEENDVPVIPVSKIKINGWPERPIGELDEEEEVIVYIGG